MGIIQNCKICESNNFNYLNTPKALANKKKIALHETEEDELDYRDFMNYLKPGEINKIIKAVNISKEKFVLTEDRLTIQKQN